MILEYGRMTNEEPGAYKSSPWSNLGHPVFEDDYLFSLEEIEWWNVKELESDDIIDP